MTAAQEIGPRAIETVRGALDRPLVLVGLMGVGKSTVGQRLAGLLGTGFVDSDTAIEAASRMSVSEIFSRFGEAYFRAGERRVISRLIEEKHGVIATGGGAFMDPETRALILERAVAIWLDCDVATLVSRTRRRDNRPLLRDGDPHEILSRLHRERSPAYAEAPIRIVTGKMPHHATALTIVEAVEQWL